MILTSKNKVIRILFYFTISTIINDKNCISISDNFQVRIELDQVRIKMDHLGMDFESLLSIEDIENLAVIPEYFRKNYLYNVEVTHIETPSRFFIRLVQNSHFVNIISNISGGNLKKSLKYYVGDIVLYNDEMNPEILRRGQILSNKPTTSRTLLPEFEYVIQAIDYGFVSYAIKRSTIWDCSIDVDPVAYECELARCRPLKNTWDDVSKKGLRRLINGQSLRMICHSHNNDKLVIDLSTHSYNISDLMIMKRWAKLNATM